MRRVRHYMFREYVDDTAIVIPLCVYQFPEIRVVGNNIAFTVEWVWENME